ncbi:NAD(FAD)-dependent dehydrogenase [Pseudomonas amygdali pv. tabaci str. ATCC 11528]|uniref:(2Fe-2S)-binding protein n=2 Tax=Pseudomonas syringae group genomosp. 2 TaxID=251698 RepID=A0AAX1VMB0_PSEAJ|nr:MULTISPECIES: (2Fe-2S)-binding protein [Pseudomonas syringae group genomosp. 2]MDU8501843.1 (2Fe-2S)-binding protein [Pseudomonas syringae]KEZ25326.1 NAD(FAD)-dependent dehydrogenase [Pseudomonas amygdali pv. tabaci str. 6605]KEZ70048.1 NAD(FAD)-dependent dehydrogenase [Pseudomonas amygdali pv. tabaci str. ATCC 11528]KIY16056.1 NAD(FAD)-dependent dehydrogenase [Pseudomonas amygdali pv. tabaci]KKY50632.1 NAD(FAD)-dependent dehydrogenase [Pseudomonas amygdali pv. tabaci str. ATCC 11528]
MNGRFVRLGERDRPVVSLMVDGAPIEALQGDTLMVALLTRKATLRQSEFDSGRRAGFCLMGACQDCWVWTRNGERLRACSNEVRDGLDIVTTQPEAKWPLLHG